jgi:catechol 2,3-dioxygenase-like lactoylglutathione lyase family enzyme
MKTKPFYTNHFGLHLLYNGANRIYLHELAGETHRRVADEKGRLALVELPVARRETSLLRSQFQSPRSSLEGKLIAQGVQPKTQRAKKRQAALPLSPVESMQ